MQPSLSNAEIIKAAPSVGAVRPFKEVSDRYSFVPTIQVVDLFRECGWLPVMAKQSGVRKKERKGFQKHMIRFRHHRATAAAAERLDLLLVNSHDRGCAFNLMASVFRLVCENGLIVGTEYANFRHKHIGFEAEKLAQSAYEIANSAGEIAAEVDDLKTIEMKPDEKGIFAMAAHQLLYEDPEKAPIKPEQLLEPRRTEDDKDDLWTTFNVLQENVIKGGLLGHTRGKDGRIRRTKTRPVKAIDRDVKLNRALWVLTEKMRELKS